MFKVFLICLTLSTTSLSAQTVYSAKQGKAVFFAEAPVSDIRGESDKLIASIDTSTGKVKAEININSFSFDKSLMQKHFNDRYMESDKFPFASFEGKISDVVSWTTPGSYKTSVDGFMLIHGVKSRRQFPLTIAVMDFNLISVHSVFKVRLADHGIKIPTLFFKEITDEVVVTLKLDFTSASPTNTQTHQIKIQNK